MEIIVDPVVMEALGQKPLLSFEVAVVDERSTYKKADVADHYKCWPISHQEDLGRSGDVRWICSFQSNEPAILDAGVQPPLEDM